MRVMRPKRWHTATLIVLQLLFAACATSVLIYRALGWAPEVFDFGWLSYRASNIYISLAVVGYLVWGLLCGHRHVLPVLAVFSLFHLVEGVIIAFSSKAVIHLITLIVLAWIVFEKSAWRRPASSIAR